MAFQAVIRIQEDTGINGQLRFTRQAAGQLTQIKGMINGLTPDHLYELHLVGVTTGQELGPLGSERANEQGIAHFNMTSNNFFLCNGSVVGLALVVIRNVTTGQDVGRGVI